MGSGGVFLRMGRCTEGGGGEGGGGGGGALVVGGVTGQRRGVRPARGAQSTHR